MAETTTTSPAGEQGAARRVRMARFLVDGTEIALNLQFEGAIKMTAGLKPDTWRALTTFREFDKLGGDVDRTGTIQLYGTTRPGDAQTVVADESIPAGEPDVTIAGVCLVDAEPAEAGKVLGDDTSRAVVFRLFFADFRSRFAPPRGGRVRVGVINPTRKPDADDTAAAITMSTAQLIVTCLQAMGLGDVPVPPEANAVDAPKDIKWLGNSAVTELARLLSHAGLVFVPRRDGTAAIVRQGTGEAPTFAETIADVELRGADRRAKHLVVASYPMRALATIRSGDLPPDAWEFVYEDAEGKWHPLPDDALEKVKKHDPAADGFYRYIRLKNDLFDPRRQSIQSKIVKMDWSQEPLVVMAVVAEFRNNQWRNAEAAVRVPVVQVVGDQNVLAFGRRLGTVSIATGDFDAYFVPMTFSPTAFDLTMSVELVQEVNDKLRPRFFEAGFTRTPNGSAAALDEDATALAMTDGQTEVLTEPSLVLVEDGEESNADALAQRAAKLAAAYFAGSAEPVRVVRTPGFAPLDLNGKVSEIEYDQAANVTTVRVNTWHRPTGGHAASDYRRLADREGGGGVPHEARTAAARSALGSAGASPNVIPLGLPPLPIVAAAGIFPAKIRGPFDSTASNRYAWDEVQWPATTAPSNEPPAILPDGRNSGGQGDERPAIEINQSQSVPAEAIVWIHELAPSLGDTPTDGTEPPAIYAFAWGAASPFFLGKVTAYVIGTGPGTGPRYEWEELLPDGSAAKPDGRRWDAAGMARASEINGRTDMAPGEIVWMWAGLQTPAATAETPEPAPVTVIRFHAGRREAVLVEPRVKNNTKSNWYNAILKKWNPATNAIGDDDINVLAVNFSEQTLASGSDPAGHVAPLNVTYTGVVLSRLAPDALNPEGKPVVAFHHSAQRLTYAVIDDVTMPFSYGKYSVSVLSGGPNVNLTGPISIAHYGSVLTPNAIGWYAPDYQCWTLRPGQIVTGEIIGTTNTGQVVINILAGFRMPIPGERGTVLQVLDEVKTIGFDFLRF
jgi:hypothetical protein